MTEQTIVHIPASQYKNLIDLDGKKKVSSAAAEVVKRFPLEYGFRQTPDCGQYGRVLEVIPAPGKKGKNLVAVSLFGYTLDEGDQAAQPVTVVVLEEDAVTAATLDAEALEALAGRDRLKYIRRKTYKEILDAVFPNKYEFIGTELIIHFPEITITNENEASHVIKDLFVKLKFTPDLTRFTQTPIGLRTTLTRAEVAGQYRHSHLPRQSNTWNTFCLGHTPLADVSTDFISGRIDYDKFLVYLYQLDDYVRWESLAGGPFIRLEGSVLSRGVANYVDRLSSRSERTSNYCPTDNQAGWPRILESAGRILHNIGPSDITYKILHTGEIKWFVKLDNPNLLRVMHSYWSGNTYEFDEVKQQYVSTSNTGGSYADEKSAFLRGSAVTFRGTRFSPRISDDEDQAVITQQLVRRMAPAAIIKVIKMVNWLLNHPREIYSLE